MHFVNTTWRLKLGIICVHIFTSYHEVCPSVLECSAKSWKVKKNRLQKAQNLVFIKFGLHLNSWIYSWNTHVNSPPTNSSQPHYMARLLFPNAALGVTLITELWKRIITPHVPLPPVFHGLKHKIVCTVQSNRACFAYSL